MRNTKFKNFGKCNSKPTTIPEEKNIWIILLQTEIQIAIGRGLLMWAKSTQCGKKTWTLGENEFFIQSLNLYRTQYELLFKYGNSDSTHKILPYNTEENASFDLPPLLSLSFPVGKMHGWLSRYLRQDCLYNPAYQKNLNECVSLLSLLVVWCMALIIKRSYQHILEACYLQQVLTLNSSAIETLLEHILKLSRVQESAPRTPLNSMKLSKTVAQTRSFLCWKYSE